MNLQPYSADHERRNATAEKRVAVMERREDLGDEFVSAIFVCGVGSLVTVGVVCGGSWTAGLLDSGHKELMLLVDLQERSSNKLIY